MDTRYCPLCGKPAVQNGKCQACQYVIGSDPDIDNDPVPMGGYSDEVLSDYQYDRRNEVWSGICALAWVVAIVGLIVCANGGPVWIWLVGFFVGIGCVIRKWRQWGREHTIMRYNQRMYWLHGKRPDNSTYRQWRL